MSTTVIMGVKSIELDLAVDTGEGDGALVITLYRGNREPEYLNLHMPYALALEYASAINAVNDKGREVEGEPVEVPEPVADEDKLEPLEWRV